ncbi:hypothetical protein [Niabella beijingensis]|uniref:hypothetical protein n=1 Tax=Niabella beijingensis TaxID=2872700 RepID=UPI001CC19B63|nr:hypothetical protein [Niabella beijingensis]MBZ4192652.1 hypothetical protein [Niabella beijingensis]
MNLLHSIEQNKLVKSVIDHMGFSKVNFAEYRHKKEWDDQYTFYDCSFGDYFFDRLNIHVVNDNIWLTLYTKQKTYFDDSKRFFGVDGMTYEKEPYVSENGPIREFKKKLGRFNMFGKEMRIVILKSDAYGCIIRIHSISKNES